MSILSDISQALMRGRAKEVKALTQQALDEGLNAKSILDEGLLSGMMEIGVKFKANEVYVPEVLVAARAMNAGLAILEPRLAEMGAEPAGRAVIGTVKGDLHDIGKNLVSMMLRGAGIEVFDLGVDVDANAFVEKAREIGADLICMSALLTTTMPSMQGVVEKLKGDGLRDQFIVMIGGAPITQAFCEEIGADYYTADAASAAQVALAAVKAKRA